jgi:hypothetical protein
VCRNPITTRYRPSQSHWLTPTDNDLDDGLSARPRVSFSGTVNNFDDSFQPKTNPVDSILSFMTSDIRSIVFGLVGVLVLLVNRLWFADNYGDAESTSSIVILEQDTRSNLLALIACGSVLVNGVSKLNVDTVLAEKVELIGMSVDKVMFLNGEHDETTGDTSLFTSQQQVTIEWALSAILAATPSSSALLLQYADDKSWKIVACTGILPAVMTQADNDDAAADIQPIVSPPPTKTPILDRFKADTMQQESYLPTLQNLPGKTEFTYLPSNTQAVVLVPAGPSKVIVLGSNQAKSFTPRDIAWCLTVASRLEIISKQNDA